MCNLRVVEQGPAPAAIGRQGTGEVGFFGIATLLIANTQRIGDSLGIVSGKFEEGVLVEHGCQDLSVSGGQHVHAHHVAHGHERAHLIAIVLARDVHRRLKKVVPFLVENMGQSIVEVAVSASVDMGAFPGRCITRRHFEVVLDAFYLLVKPLRADALADASAVVAGAVNVVHPVGDDGDALCMQVAFQDEGEIFVEDFLGEGDVVVDDDGALEQLVGAKRLHDARVADGAVILRVFEQAAVGLVPAGGIDFEHPDVELLFAGVTQHVLERFRWDEVVGVDEEHVLAAGHARPGVAGAGRRPGVCLMEHADEARMLGSKLVAVLGAAVA